MVYFRPLYLPTRAVLTVESFSISSNVVVESPVSMLRYIYLFYIIPEKDGGLTIYKSRN